MKNEFLEEIWRVREKLAARFDYDLHRMVVHLQKQQAKHGARLVRAPGPAVTGGGMALHDEPPPEGGKSGGAKRWSH